MSTTLKRSAERAFASGTAATSDELAIYWKGSRCEFRSLQPNRPSALEPRIVSLLMLRNGAKCRKHVAINIWRVTDHQIGRSDVVPDRRVRGGLQCFRTQIPSYLGRSARAPRRSEEGCSDVG